MKTLTIFLLLTLSLMVLTDCHTAPGTTGTSGTENDFTLTPFPRIGMLWRPVRGEKGLKSYARHDLITVGSCFMGLVPNREPAALADGFTPVSIDTARSRIQRFRERSKSGCPGQLTCCSMNTGSNAAYDHPWWLRKEGERVQSGWVHTGWTGIMKITGIR